MNERKKERMNERMKKETDQRKKERMNESQTFLRVAYSSEEYTTRRNV